MDKKIIFTITISFIIFFCLGFLTSHLLGRARFNELTDKLAETEILNNQFREFKEKYGITIGELPRIYQGLQDEIEGLREERKRKDQEYRKFIKEFERNQSEIGSSIQRFGFITESLRSENERSLGIIEKYTSSNGN